MADSMKYLRKPLLAGALSAVVDKVRGKDLFGKRTLEKAGILAASVLAVDYFSGADDFDMDDFGASLYKPAEVGAVNVLGNMAVGESGSIVKTFAYGAAIEIVADLGVSKFEDIKLGDGCDPSKEDDDIDVDI